MRIIHFVNPRQESYQHKSSENVKTRHQEMYMFPKGLKWLHSNVKAFAISGVETPGLVRKNSTAPLASKTILIISII